MIPRLRPYYNHQELIAAFSFWQKNVVPQYEHQFAETLESKYALAYPYGRSALHAIFKTLQLKDAEIILPAYTCVVVAHAISLSGNIPRFVDISLTDYNMDLDQLADRITPKTRAVVATHLFGYPLYVVKLNEIVTKAEKIYGHKIWIIQDCAHSFGAKWQDKNVNNFGDCAIYGLNISKIISSIFGGMITTNNKKLYQQLLRDRNNRYSKTRPWKTIHRLSYLLSSSIALYPKIYGLINFLENNTSLVNSATQYYNETIINFPKDYLDQMMDIEARVGLVQLKKYPTIIKERQKNAQYYSKHLSNIQSLCLPPLIDGATYSHYVIRVDDREKILKAMLKKGIQLGWLIEYSIPEMKAYKKWKDREFPNALLCSKKTINLPVWPGLMAKDLDKIIHKLIQFSKS